MLPTVYTSGAWLQLRPHSAATRCLQSDERVIIRANVYVVVASGCTADPGRSAQAASRSGWVCPVAARAIKSPHYGAGREVQPVERAVGLQCGKQDRVIQDNWAAVDGRSCRVERLCRGLKIKARRRSAECTEIAVSTVGRSERMLVAAAASQTGGAAVLRSDAAAQPNQLLHTAVGRRSVDVR